MGLLDNIKNDVKKAGTNKGKFIFFKEGEKRRIRFLQDMPEGMEISFHDSFAASVNVPCQEIFGRSCPYCDEEGLRTRTQYVWSVWDYDANEVKLFMFPVNNCTPVPQLVALYETYGTLTDRDYMVSVSGKQQNKTYTVIGMDKVKFRNDKAKPFSEKRVYDMLDKAYPSDSSPSTSDKDSWGDGGKYDSKGAKELYEECVKREIDVEMRKPQKYYIEKLEEDDEKSSASSKDDWGDEEQDDGYESKGPKDLYDLCVEKGIDAEKRKPQAYYVNLLREFDKAKEDWGDEQSEQDGWGDDDDDWG